MIIVTTPSVDGYEISQYHGIVFGEVVAGTNVIKDIGAGLRDVFGGRSKGYEEEFIKSRQEALTEMEERAKKMGANAIVGVDFDYEVLGASGTILMVVASGTAVSVNKKE